MRPLDPRLLAHARGASRSIAVLVALGVVTAVCVIIQAQLLATGITTAFTGSAVTGGHGTGTGRELSLTLLTALAAVIAVRAAAAWASEAVAGKASAAAISGLRRGLLGTVLRRGPSATTAGHSGQPSTGPAPRSTAALAELATHGLDTLDGYFTGYLPALILAVAVPLAVLVRIAIADPLSGITVAVTLPLVPLFGALIGTATGRHAQERRQALQTLAHHFLDVTAGLPTLKVFGRDRAQRDQIARVTGEYRKATMGTLRLAFLSGFALELVATMSVALVATEIGLRLAYGQLGLTTGLMVLILAPEAYLPLRAIGAQFHATAGALEAAGQTFTLLERPARAPAQTALCQIQAEGQIPAGGQVRVEDLSVRHEGRPAPAPDGLSLTIAPGRITALAGPSGCGKSTLISVLLGFTAPDGGQVTATTADSAELAQPLTSGVLRNDAGWLPQDPVLFPGTVAANIRLGWPDAPDDAVREAARKAALDDVPLGRVLGEHGAGLSAGQRRRVALARALLPGRRFLLLDEPAAGLDAAREALITATLRAEARAGRAVLVVSHHPAVLEAADEVIRVGAALAGQAAAGQAAVPA